MKQVKGGRTRERVETDKGRGSEKGKEKGGTMRKRREPVAPQIELDETSGK
jgi:hypothetical protein